MTTIKVKFKGVIQSTEPTTGLVDGLMWYESDAAGAPTSTFQVKVYSAESSAFGAAEDYTAAKGDEFMNVNDSTSYVFDGSAFGAVPEGEKVLTVEGGAEIAKKVALGHYQKGYLVDNVFYLDEDHKTVIPGKIGKLYFDLTSKQFYVYDEDSNYYKPLATASHKLTGLIALSLDDLGTNYEDGMMAYIVEKPIEKVEDMPLEFDVYTIKNKKWSTSTTKHKAAAEDYFKNQTVAEDYQYYLFDSAAWTQIDDSQKKVDKISEANIVYTTDESGNQSFRYIADLTDTSTANYVEEVFAAAGL